MHIEIVPKARLEGEWPTLADALLPVVREDPNGSIEGLRQKLLAGSAVLFHADGEANGYLVVEVSQEDGRLVGWVSYAIGGFTGGPKARLAMIRHGLAEIENAMRNAGCAENRICGRDWSRVLPDYEPFTERRNGLRKVL